jgi:hypothetical protein
LEELKRPEALSSDPFGMILMIRRILSSTPAREDLKTERKERIPVKIKSNVKAGQGLWGQ